MTTGSVPPSQFVLGAGSGILTYTGNILTPRTIIRNLDQRDAKSTKDHDELTVFNPVILLLRQLSQGKSKSSGPHDGCDTFPGQ